MSDSADKAFKKLVDGYLERHPGISRKQAEIRVKRNEEVRQHLQPRQRVQRPQQRPNPEPPRVVDDLPRPLPVVPGEAEIAKKLIGQERFRQIIFGENTRAARGRAVPSSMKMFRPLGWHSYRTTYYISHLLTELGRLGLEAHDLGRRSDGESVLSDLICWMDDLGHEPNLYDWRRLNLPLLLERAERNRYSPVKPRITVYAHITARDNLSVLWYPTGWNESYWDAEKRRANCDFLSFNEDARMFDRPPNELMFIHGVQNLHPGDPDTYPYLRYNKPVVDGLLICAVRSAYDNLIRRLERTFEVTLRTVFVFEERDDQVVGWSLEDPRVIQRQKDQAELATVEQEFGFSVEAFSEQLRIITETDTPHYKIDQKLSRKLTKDGHKITPSRVERLRNLITRAATRLDEYD